MESLEARPGQEDARPHPGLGDQGHGSGTMVERKSVDGYRLVDVYLTGGAPWGFTLKGGREHGEHLIITKVEEGSKAAETLMAGDEIVNINDFPLSGFRQEAICLVKGSHKTLKMIVKRRIQVMMNVLSETMPSDKDLLLARGFLMNILRTSMRKSDIAYRPHSWHSTKIIGDPMETLNANSNFNPSWNSRYPSSSSSYDLSNTWDQSNLQRSSGHYSSVGSMDSIDQSYQPGRLSSAKSNNSIDYLGNQNKRDSAYGSLSTSFINPDLNLSKTSAVSTENILYQINEWENSRPIHGRTGQYLQEPKRPGDQQGYQSPSITFYEGSKPQRTDENVEGRNSVRSHFGPVWNVPDKKKTSSPPPPPPPLRSDSYAVTKSHEKPVPTNSELTSTQHFNVANRSQSRTDWDPEIQDYRQRPFRPPDRKLGDTRRINNNSYKSEINLDQIGSYAKFQNNTKLQASQSSYDVRFAQPSYGYHHQRQYSDESTFFQNTRMPASIKAQPQQVAFSSGSHDGVGEAMQVYNTHHIRVPSSESESGGRIRSESNTQCHITSASSRVSPQGGGLRHPYREEYGKMDVLSNPQTMQDNGSPKSSFGLPQQNNQPSPENCDMYKKESHLSSSDRMKPRKSSDFYEEHFSSYDVPLHDLTNKTVSTNKYRPHLKDYCWNEEGSKITPQITPMLHSLTQEGRHRLVISPDSDDKKNLFEAAKQTRRSDRFATTLRNEIQQRRAHLQKSKSTATLTESTEGEDSENWNQDSLESVNTSSDGSFSNTYKNHLKEAQARVLRATSFKRRDLEPVIADPSLSPERKVQGYSISKPALNTEVTYPTDHFQQRQVTAMCSSQNIARIGGRKRFTTQQKLRSYSEPEKMNEVGVRDDNENVISSKASQKAVGSFADRRKFFEETSKPVPSKSVPRRTPPAFPEEHFDTQCNKNNENVPKESWNEKRSRAASLGAELLIDGDKQPKDCYQDTSYRTSDSVSAQQPQRLETFAEYQASWREQKKPLERKNSSRCHSADNILDSGLDQNERSTYVHERSKSSPTTDFYAKGGIVDSKKQADSEGVNAESARLTHCSSSSRGSSGRVAETGYLEKPSVSKEDILHDDKHKPTHKPLENSDTVNVPQQSRTRSGTLPSDYRFVNENVRYRSGDISFSAVIPISETPCDSRSQSREEIQQQDLVPVQKKRGPAPQRPPPPKLDKYWKQNGSSSSLSNSSESLLTPAQGKTVPPYSSTSLDVIHPDITTELNLGVPSDKSSSVCLRKPQLSGSPEDERQPIEKKTSGPEPERSSKPCYLQKPGMEPSRSPSPQFAPQKLTDKPPLLVQDENLTRIERVIENTKVKMVPIKIVHSESDAEKESRTNLLSAIEPPSLHAGIGKDPLKTLSTSEQSYSLFCAYTRHGQDEEEQSKDTDNELVQEPSENIKESPQSFSTNNSKSKDLIYADLKSEELVREIVGKDKSLADILDPARMMTTMDLMEGIFRKDEHLLEEAQQRRKVNPKVPSPKPPEEQKEDQNLAAAISLTTSSTYYSTSAPKAELLIKMKDMKEQQPIEESSEDEMDHNLCEKKQELIDSISRKLQVLRDARETLLEDVQCNNALGEEVEVIVKEVCKPNEFDKFRMFVGDLEKIVNLLLSLSGRLARVENALNNLDEAASPEERRTLIEKRKLLTRQHEDAKELKENLDRRERTVFEILANYLNEENLADYEHFVKMKSALILEQRELEDKIKLGEEQLKCLTDSLTAERFK